MRDRPTVRVLLLDADGRLLPMKGRLPGAPAGPAAWFTVGGGAEPGETVTEAAIREVREETGFTEVAFGPVIWRRAGRLADVLSGRLPPEPVTIPWSWPAGSPGFTVASLTSA